MPATSRSQVRFQVGGRNRAQSLGGEKTVRNTSHRYGNRGKNGGAAGVRGEKRIDILSHKKTQRRTMFLRIERPVQAVKRADPRK